MHSSNILIVFGADGACVDVDECSINNGNCQMRCENLFGGYQCRCAFGYNLVVSYFVIILCGCLKLKLIFNN